jgi:hypothetical protein
MPPVEFEPRISADERPKTYALDRAATATGHYYVEVCKKPTFTLYDALCVAGSGGGKNSGEVDTLQDNLHTQVLTPLALKKGAELIC